MNYVRTARSVPPNKPMNPTPLRGSLVAALLGAVYGQPVSRTKNEDFGSFGRHRGSLKQLTLR